MKLFGLFLVIFFLSFQIQTAYAFQEKVEGLEYVVRKIEEPSIDRFISKRFDLYELYFENRSDKTFSIPGYSIDFGVDYSGLSDISSFSKDKSLKKNAVLNIAAGAASIAFGGFAKSAANTAMRVGSFRKSSSNLNDEKSFLSSNRTYVIYPDESLSLFFFLDKFTTQPPASVKYICHDEVQNVNYVVINRNLDLREISTNDDSDKNVIAVPGSNEYK